MKNIKYVILGVVGLLLVFYAYKGAFPTGNLDEYEELHAKYTQVRDSLHVAEELLRIEQEMHKAHADSLVELGFKYMGIAESLKQTVRQLDKEKNELEENLLTYRLPIDSLVSDLNRMWADVQSGRVHDVDGIWRYNDSDPKRNGSTLSEPVFRVYTFTPAAVHSTGQCHYGPRSATHYTSICY